MYADDTLTPKEASRLCALGTLADGPMCYGELASSIRHFISHVLGPTLDLTGTSVELLKYEGLVMPIHGIGMENDPILAITEAGQKALRMLLTANLRATATDLNKLITALKFRFLHLLDPTEQSLQVEALTEFTEMEQTRLIDLRQHHCDDAGYIHDWLNHEIGQLELRMAWLKNFRPQPA